MIVPGPLFWYELRRLPRRGHPHRWRALYAAALLLGLVAVYLRTFRGLAPPDALTGAGALDRAGHAAFAETFLMVFLAVQQLAVVVLTPLYAAGSIADEKEHRTLDFLLASPLPHYQILLGKLLARLAFVGGVIAVGWPVLMLTFLFGGVDAGHLLAGFAVAAVTAIFLGALGVLLACRADNLRETLPELAAALVAPALLGLGGLFHPLLAAASPLTALGFLLRMWRVGDPAHDATWPLVAAFAATHLALAAVFFFAARNALGHRGASEPGETVVAAAARTPAIRRTYDVPPLGDDEDPLYWKERGFGLAWYSPQRGWVQMAMLAALCWVASVPLMILFTKLAIDLSEGRGVAGTAGALAGFVFVPMVSLWPAFLGARVAACLGRERAGQTLPALFALPVDRPDILKAIVRAILHRDRRLIRFAGAALLLAVVSGGVGIAGAGAAAVLTFGAAAWAVAFALWLSVRVETPARASLIFLGVWGGLLLLPWLAAPFAGPDFREVVELACPPHGMARALPVLTFGETADGLPVWVALAVGVGLTAVGAGFAWHAARAFEQEGKA